VVEWNGWTKPENWKSCLGASGGVERMELHVLPQSAVLAGT
jgi:hypothetical protein